MNFVAQERKGVSFDIEELSWILYGSKAQFELRQQVIRDIENDPILFAGVKEYERDFLEHREICWAKVVRITQILKDKPKEYQDAFNAIMGCVDRSVSMRHFVHFPLFLGQIIHSGTKEQQDRWVKPAENLQIIGCFGMTELGHSSYLQGIETTAEFDSNSDEFIIHSTKPTATKVWIGLSSHTATHIIVFARLIINGKEYGVQLFMVQLRDPNTGRLLPGRRVGDMGPKFGRAGLDNGWVRFNHVRIPRKDMLMRWTQVDASGNVSLPSQFATALAYGQTVMERVSSARSASYFSICGLTVAIRYVVTRTQGVGDPQVMNFQAIQHRLLPHLATSYACWFATSELWKQFCDAQTLLEQGNEAEFLSGLPERHAQSCGYKAFLSWWTVDALETSRRCLGGHGYSMFSAVPALIGDFGVVTTGGGDNIVIAQQLAKFLVKNWKTASRKPVFGAVEYFTSGIANEIRNSKSISWPVKTFEDLNDLSVFPQAYDFLALWLIHRAASRLVILSADLSESDAWNETMMDLLACARAHIWRSVLYSFLIKLQSLESTASQAINNALKNVFKLFALFWMEAQLGDLMKSQYISPAQAELVSSSVLRLSKELRKDVIGLSDAFAFPDIVLNSPLGAYDGDLYTKYLSALENTRGTYEVVPYWEKLIKPLTSKL